MSKSKTTLAKPIMVRMDHEMLDRIKAIAQANGLTTSDIVRLSVKRQLPAIASGQTRFVPA